MSAPIPGTITGSYTLERLLGQGGFAWVYAARRSDGKSFAIKILKPRFAGDESFRTRFRQESEFAAQLAHPHIVHIEEVGHESDLVHFTMDLYPDTLAAMADRDTILPEGRIVEIATDIASALSFAHARGIIHRDIKLDNILLGEKGEAVLTDFGIARAISGYVAATGFNMTIGTPHYISPEQAQGRPLDGRSDLYSLGVTLYRVATGELPFKSKDWFELARMHVEAKPEAPRTLRPDLGRRLERIILKCLSKHQDDRYASAEELISDLDDTVTKERPTTDITLPAGYLTRDMPKTEPEKKKWWKP
ncbi:MAG: serine/threonine-protein kinase [Gemmatimonadota bacterium]